MFELCLAPDTSGDGTGCDNMTCIIVTFNGFHNNNQSAGSKRSAPDDVTDGEKTEEKQTKKPRTEMETDK